MDDRYNTRLDNKYGQSELIDIPSEVAAHQPWFNQTLTQVNDCVVRLGIISTARVSLRQARARGRVTVLDGELLYINVRGKDTMTLTKHLGYTVPAPAFVDGVHRTRAHVKTVILMVEAATVTPTGDA